MDNSVERDCAWLIQHERNSEGAHIGNAVLVAGYEEAENEQHHGEHFGAVAFQGHRYEKCKAYEPIAKDGAEE